MPSILPIISLIGGPGSGKSSLSSKLAEKFKLDILSTKQLIQNEIETKTQKGQVLEVLMKQGKTVNDNDIISIYKKSIFIRSDNTNGFILDGFPETKTLFQSFECFISPIDMVIYLDCPDETLVERCSNRAMNSAFASQNLDEQITSFKQVLESISPLISNKNLVANAALSPESIYESVAPLVENQIKQKAASHNDVIARRSLSGSVCYECRQSK